MKDEVNDYIVELQKLIFVNKKEFPMANHLEICGWLMREPAITKNYNNDSTEIAHFLLFIPKEKGYYCYPCQTFNDNVVKMLADQKVVGLVHCLGKILMTFNKKYVLTIVDAKVIYNIPEMPLLPPLSKRYETKEKKRK